MEKLSFFVFGFLMSFTSIFFDGDGKFNQVDKLVNDAIKDKAFPGAVLLVAKDGKILHQQAYGFFTYDKDATPVTASTIYDLASVSKVIATTTAVMICYDRKLFSLDDKVYKYIPDFAANGKENISIKNLLLHNSGLPAYKKYYDPLKSKDEILADIYSSSLEYPTGTKTVYSDLGMITVGKIIEKVSGKTLDKFCYDEIFKPLGMKNTFYNPSKKYKDRIAPTELDDYWRKRLLIGEVHDETASLLGGVAGHAGLFSTAEDIYHLLQMLLDGGTYKGKRLINEETIKFFTTRYSPESTRGIGWDTKSAEGSSAGTLYSANSFGHTGYTGTSVWIDKDRKLITIFLTNRVHPTRNNNKIIKVRPLLHNEIINTIEPR
ncbi:MAG: serine hydrolase domain-containing protein [Syntrophothermus sp.]